MPDPDYLRAKKELEQAVMYCPGEKARKEPTELALKVLANAIKKYPKRQKEEVAPMAGEICPECYAGMHSDCIEQGCYCECQLVDQETYALECPHGLARCFCEQCEQEEQ